MVLEVFVHPGCASERAALVVAREIRQLVPELDIQIRSVVQDHERAEEAGVFVVPAFILDGTLLSVGVPTKEWLLAKLKEAAEHAASKHPTGKPEGRKE